MSILRWLALPAVLVLAWVTSRFGERWIGPIEVLTARFATKKSTVIGASALAVVLLRLALLPILPVPVPDGHDEFSYLLAADTFAHGRVANSPHSLWVLFDTFHELGRPTYASIFPPAQGAALALGQLLGHPWIGVLLSVALMSAAITWMLQQWLPPRWALLGSVLVLLRLDLFSYWLESYWGGSVAATGGALVVGALPRIIRYQRPRDGFLMGLGVAILANSRPLEGFVFCIPAAVVLLAWLFSKRSPTVRVTGRRVLIPLLSVLTLMVVFMGYYNWRVTGNSLLLPHALYQGEYINNSVFLWQKAPPPLRYANPEFETYFNSWVRVRFSPALANSKRLLWDKLFESWQFFCGKDLWVPFLALPWVISDRRVRFLLIQFFSSCLGLLAVVYFHPHYAAPLAASLIALLVQCMRHLRLWTVRGRPVGIFLTRLVVLLAFARVALYVAESPRPVDPDVAWSHSRAQIVKQLGGTQGSHLVLVRYTPSHHILAEWVYNAADIDHSKVVWAREIPGVDLKPLFEYFHGRTIWLLEADRLPIQLKPYPSAAPAEAFNPSP